MVRVPTGGGERKVERCDVKLDVSYLGIASRTRKARDKGRTGTGLRVSSGCAVCGCEVFGDEMRVRPPLVEDAGENQTEVRLTLQAL